MIILSCGPLASVSWSFSPRQWQNNGELFVLNMGQPVKILELAENMIRLSGLVPYKDIDIIENSLLPGEKLYEELLVNTEELDKTEKQPDFYRAGQAGQHGRSK